MSKMRFAFECQQEATTCRCNKEDFSSSPSQFFLPLVLPEHHDCVTGGNTSQSSFLCLKWVEWITSLNGSFWTFGSPEVFQHTSGWKDKISGQSEENPAPGTDFEGIYWRLRWWGSHSHLPVLGGCWTWAPALRWGNTNGMGMWERATGGGRGVLRDGRWAVTSFSHTHTKRWVKLGSIPQSLVLTNL